MLSPFWFSHSAVGVLNYPNQVEKRSTASTDSPIYSTINTAAAEDDLLAYYDTYSSASYTQGPDPYSSNPILANSGLVGLEQDLDHWTIQSGQSGSEYAKLQYCKKSKGEEIRCSSNSHLEIPHLSLRESLFVTVFQSTGLKFCTQCKK